MLGELYLMVKPPTQLGFIEKNVFNLYKPQHLGFHS